MGLWRKKCRPERNLTHPVPDPPRRTRVTSHRALSPGPDVPPPTGATPTAVPVRTRPRTKGARRGPRRVVAALVAAITLGLTACAGPADTATVPPASATTSAPATTPSAGTESSSSLTSATVEAPGTAPVSTAPSPAAVATDPTLSAPSAPASAGTPLSLPDSAPVSLSVPAIGVSSPLSTLGRNPDGTVEVPSLDDPDAGAGWFRDSPEPGALGPAIILGHVDSRRFGPGVFYDLKKLQAGDAIEISRADGSVAVFTVDSVEDVPKAQFPTQRVYGNLDHAGLRLITCGGVFDSDAGSYEDNIIAFASLTSSRSA
ncbi:class F sortase [Nakamurella flava]|uniref:Class F sortase n=1 Tax=Nakamurella flava TaxID=2576308 RepID=A0A4U6QJX8_9ACTN|nr:class F sortase [Nakamurella flava]TKV60398.1 class F sortase [Nakamurella flava]